MPFDAKSGMAKEWPDRRILYPRAEEHGLSGRIFAKCTLRQRFFSLKRTKCVYLAKIDCPRVHFSEILPESRLPTAQEYKMFFSCHADGRIGASLPQIGQLALPPPPPIGKGRFAHPKEPTPPYAFIITPTDWIQTQACEGLMIVASLPAIGFQTKLAEALPMLAAPLARDDRRQIAAAVLPHARGITA